jgi:hypothetical protein
LGIDAEKEAKRKEVATISPERSIHEPSQKEIFFPFEKAKQERIFPEAEKISKYECIPISATILEKTLKSEFRCQQR